MPMDAYEQILLSLDDGVATLTLNRPEKLNAYLPEMGDEIVHAFRRLREDDEVRAVIVTGAGRGFCAGVDLEVLRNAGENAGPGPQLGEEDFVRKLPLEIWNFPKPVIAAINGAAIGVGAVLPEGAFYLWVEAPDGDAWAFGRRLAAELGVVVSPGEFYGEAGTGHVRLAAVAVDERIDLVRERSGA